MDFGETLLAAQRNQQQNNSDNVYYRSKYEPPKKEQKPAARLSANIQKFLAKKEEEERRKQEEARRKRDELLAMRDPKATKKIQKMLKVIKSANKSVLEEATDREHTAITRSGAEQPDQDDYGYESQEAAALYSKMMEKYSKIPEEEKFPAPRGNVSKKDLEGTRERMRAALQREEDSVNQPRQRKTKAQMQAERGERGDSPPPVEKKVEKEKPKVRKVAPPPIDFNQLLKLAEQKKDEPQTAVALLKRPAESEPERPMTKRQRKEFEEEQARKERREQRRLMEAQSRHHTGKDQEFRKQERPRVEAEKKSEITFTRIPKIGDKNISASKNSRLSSEPTRKLMSEETRKADREKYYSSGSIKQEVPRTDQKKNIDLKSQNTYRIDKNSNNKAALNSNPENDRTRSYKEDERLTGNENRLKTGIREDERMMRMRIQRQEDSGRTMRDEVRAKIERQEDRGRHDRSAERGRQEDRGRLNRSAERGRQEDRGRLNRSAERGRQEYRGRLDRSAERGRQENRGRLNRSAERGRQEERGRLDRSSERGRQEDRGRLDRSAERGRQEDRGRLHRSAERGRQEDRGRLDRSAERGRQEDRGRLDRSAERGKIQKELDRGKSNRENERGRISKPEEKTKIAREQNRQFNDQRSNIGKPSGISYQNKPIKNSEQLRKPELKEKILAKERMLFGNDRGSPKPNGVNKDKFARPNEVPRSKEGPVKLSKPGTTDRKPAPDNNKMKPSTSKLENKTFDFDKHVNSLKKVPERPGAQKKPEGMGRQFTSADVRRKFSQGDARAKQPLLKRPIVHSDSEYDSEMDDFIDDGEDDANYSAVIKEVFGYDKSKYRDFDDDDSAMESSFAQQMREEYISKKIGIMEDLEDMRMEAMEKKKSKKRMRISDDD